MSRGAEMKTPKALRGLECGEGCCAHPRRGRGFFFIFALKMTDFDELCVV